MKYVPVLASALAATVLLQPVDCPRAEPDPHDAVVRTDPPEIPGLQIYVADEHTWMLVGAEAGAGDFARPSAPGLGIPSWERGRLFFVNMSTRSARFLVCPDWRVPDCGTADPEAAPALIGTGMLELHSYVLDNGQPLLCPRLAKGDAIVADDEGNRYHLTFQQLILQDLFSNKCRTIQTNIEVTPEK